VDSAALCFFFQAEDGIRDATVTGVQTCALPISGDVKAALSIFKWADDRLRKEFEDVVLVAINENVREDCREDVRERTVEGITRRSEERRVGKEGRSRWATEQ